MVDLHGKLQAAYHIVTLCMHKTRDTVSDLADNEQSVYDASLSLIANYINGKYDADIPKALEVDPCLVMFGQRSKAAAKTEEAQS